MNGIAIKSILSSRQQRVTESSFCRWLLMTVSHKIIILHQSGLNSTLSSLELEFDTFIYYSAHTPTTSDMSHMSLHSNLAHPHISTIYYMHGIQPSQPASQPASHSVNRPPSIQGQRIWRVAGNHHHPARNDDSFYHHHHRQPTMDDLWSVIRGGSSSSSRADKQRSVRLSFRDCHDQITVDNLTCPFVCPSLSSSAASSEWRERISPTAIEP